MTTVRRVQRNNLIEFDRKNVLKDNLFRHHDCLVHQAHVPGLLLAGHVQLLRQPHRLLLDEQEVSWKVVVGAIFSG